MSEDAAAFVEADRTLATSRIDAVRVALTREQVSRVPPPHGASEGDRLTLERVAWRDLPARSAPARRARGPGAGGDPRSVRCGHAQPRLARGAGRTGRTPRAAAVTAEQIEEWNLPARPPKARDPEAKKWGDRPCVELDAIDPTRLT